MKETIITIPESLIISVFSMLIVFVGLLLISFIIGLLKNLDKSDNNKEKDILETKVIAEENTVVTQENDEEIVAVIAAAIAASLGVGIEDIVIKDIKRVGTEINSWTNAGLSEQMLSRL